MTPLTRRRLELEELHRHEEWILATPGKELMSATGKAQALAARAHRAAKRAVTEAARRAEYNASVSQQRAQTRAEKRARAEELLARGGFHSSVARELGMRREDLTKLLRAP